jgi:hypothetical protein
LNGDKTQVNSGGAWSDQAIPYLALYWLAGHAAAATFARGAAALQRLTGASDTAAWVAVYTPVGDDVSASARRLNGFVEVMWGPVDNALEMTAKR